jgi:hypothetical protein
MNEDAFCLFNQKCRIVIPVLCRTFRKIPRQQEALLRRIRNSCLPEPLWAVQQVLPVQQAVPEASAAAAVQAVVAAAVRIAAVAAVQVVVAVAVRIAAVAAAVHTAAQGYRKPDRTPNQTAQRCRSAGKAFQTVSQRPKRPA